MPGEMRATSEREDNCRAKIVNPARKNIVVAKKKWMVRWIKRVSAEGSFRLAKVWMS